jgi:hypothetical protein
MPRPKQLFISHANADRKFLERLSELLADYHIRFWHSRKDIRGAQQWHDEIGAALRKCDWFLLVLSPSVFKSKWVKRELAFALRENRYNDRIVPIIARRCDFGELSWTLPAFEVVDFSRNFAKGSEELLRIWNIPYRGRPRKPR